MAGLRGVKPPVALMTAVEGNEVAHRGVPTEDPPSTSSQPRSSSDDDSLLNMVPLGLRIMLVDPDRKRRSGIRSLLEGCQYEVTDLPSCEAALDALLGKEEKGPRRPKDAECAAGEVARGTGQGAGDGSRRVDAVLIHSGKATSEAGLRLARAIQRSEDASVNGCTVVPYSADESPAKAVQWLFAGAAAYLIEPVRRQELLTIWQHVWLRRTGNQFSGRSTNGSGSGGTGSDEEVRKSAVHKDGIGGTDGKPAHRESDGSRSGSDERGGSGQGSGGDGDRVAAVAEKAQNRGSPDGLLASDNSEGSGVTNKKMRDAQGENVNTSGTSNRRATGATLEIAERAQAQLEENPTVCLPACTRLGGNAAANEGNETKYLALRIRNGSAFSAFANQSGSKSSGSSSRRDKGQSNTSVSPTNSRGVRIPPTILPKPVAIDRSGVLATASAVLGPAHQGETHGVMPNRSPVLPVTSHYPGTPPGLAFGGYPQPMHHPMQVDVPPRHALGIAGARGHGQGVPPPFGHSGAGARMHVGLAHPYQFPLPPGPNAMMQVRSDWQQPAHYGMGAASTHSGMKGPQTIHREEALEKFRRKRANRCFDKKIRYASRKRLADGRPRVKGQFVRIREDADGIEGDGDEDDAQMADARVLNQNELNSVDTAGAGGSLDCFANDGKGGDVK